MMLMVTFSGMCLLPQKLDQPARLYKSTWKIVEVSNFDQSASTLDQFQCVPTLLETISGTN